MQDALESEVPDAHANTARLIRDTLESGAIVVGCDIPKAMGRVPLAAALLAGRAGGAAIYLAASAPLAIQACRGLKGRIQAMTVREAFRNAREGREGPALVFVDDVPPEDRELLAPLSRRWPATGFVRFDAPRPAAPTLVDGAFMVRTIVRMQSA